MKAFYNDIDPYCCAWISNLMDAGLITPGKIDDRSIREISSADVAGYERVHFFCGIAGWEIALKTARWGDRPVWTGSCPCQPFSAAGQRKGTADERHLWPEFFRLISECRPSTVFGEQVASKDGRQWLAGVRADLERVAYAVGAADLCSAGVGAPHIRQRLWWVGQTEQRGLQGGHERSAGPNAEVIAEGCESSFRRVADSDGGQSRHGGLQPGGQHGQQPQDGGAGGLGHADDARSQGRRLDVGEHADQRLAKPPGELGGVGHAASERRNACRNDHDAAERPQIEAGTGGSSFWSAYDIVPCADGKARRIEPGTFPLAHGIPARVGKLRAYGNAIVPQVAAEFIQSYIEARSLT